MKINTEMDYGKEADEVSSWIEDKIFKQSKTHGVVVGLSGGLDSSVVAALSRHALGASNVYGVIMPCHSNPQDQEDAIALAEWAGIPYKVIDLSAHFDFYSLDLFNKIEHFRRDNRTLVEANIKARLRMTTLYAVANLYSAMVIGTGNLSEMLTGYFTKYGDGGVDLEPIYHFYKTEVYQMAQAFEGFPQAILDKKPSAGLWEGQNDEDDLGMTYIELDNILRTYQGLSSKPKFTNEEAWEEILKQAYRLDDGTGKDKVTKIKKVRNLVTRNEHKLRMPDSYLRLPF